MLQRSSIETIWILSLFCTPFIDIAHRVWLNQLTQLLLLVMFLPILEVNNCWAKVCSNNKIIRVKEGVGIPSPLSLVNFHRLQFLVTQAFLFLCFANFYQWNTSINVYARILFILGKLNVLIRQFIHRLHLLLHSCYGIVPPILVQKIRALHLSLKYWGHLQLLT